MTEAVKNFIPFFTGLLLNTSCLFWIADGKNGNWKSYFFGIAAIVVGSIIFINVFSGSYFVVTEQKVVRIITVFISFLLY